MKYIKCRNNFGKIVSIQKNKFFFRPSVYALIKKDGNILTLTNKSNGKYWFPGGGLEIGEKMEEALKREVQEEVGLDIKIGKLLLFRENFFYYEPLDEAYHAFLFFYECDIVGDAKIKNDNEVDDLESQKPRWTNLSDLNPDNIGDFGHDIYIAIESL